MTEKDQNGVLPPRAREFLRGRLRARCRRLQSLQFCNSSSFLESPYFSAYLSSFLYTCPPFITNFTRSSSVMSVVGSPDTATTSANLPASREPMRCCHPLSCAAPVVAASIVWTGVIPNFTMYSNSFVWLPWGKGPAPE